MAVSGIIAEFNPLHNGHARLLQFAKKENNTVVCVISGNFTQRGDTAIIPKSKRAEAALINGADLVADVRLLKLGRVLAVGDALIRSEGADAPVARASLTYSIPPLGRG